MRLKARSEESHRRAVAALMFSLRALFRVLARVNVLVSG